MAVKKSATSLKIVLTTTIALLFVATFVLCIMIPKSGNLTAAAEPPANENNIAIIANNNTINDYAGSVNSDNDPVSYGSAYPASMGKIVVQFYDTSGVLKLSETVSFLNEDIVEVGDTLATGAYYNVKIITPTFLKYTVQVTFADGNANLFSSSNFTIYNSGELMIDIFVISISDESWLTSYNTP